MKIFDSGCPAMSAERATKLYSRIFELLDAVPRDLPAHTFTTTDDPDDKAICSVPVAIGKAKGFLNFYPLQE